MMKLLRLSDLQVSPDGAWVLYTVRQPDLKEDKNHTHLWMTSWDGSQTVQLTFSKSSESQPRWSPDGKSISFVSSRGGDDDASQLWIMNRNGGEAETNLAGGHQTTLRADALRGNSPLGRPGGLMTTPRAERYRRAGCVFGRGAPFRRGCRPR